MMNLLFVSPGLYLNILKTEEILQFWDKKNSRRARHVIPTQQVKKIALATDCGPQRATNKIVHNNSSLSFLTRRYDITR